MILIWGEPYDASVSAVLTELARRHSPFIVMSSGGLWTHERSWLPSIAEQTPYVHAAFVRPQHIPAAPDDLSQENCELRMLWSWLNTSDALIYNRPRAGLSNESKLGQASFIRQAGFLFPDSIATTSPDAAKSFCHRHGAVIVKGLSGERTVAQKYDASAGVPWDNIARCPTLLQKYIAGRQYRVHTVDDVVFTHEIITKAPDYRYASRWGAKAAIVAGEIPRRIEEMCLSLASTLGLPLAGIDLISPNPDCWYCLEVNPSPAFGYFETHSKLGIAEALAFHLSKSS